MTKVDELVAMMLKNPEVDNYMYVWWKELRRMVIVAKFDERYKLEALAEMAMDDLAEKGLI